MLSARLATLFKPASVAEHRIAPGPGCPPRDIAARAATKLTSPSGRPGTKLDVGRVDQSLGLQAEAAAYDALGHASQSGLAAASGEYEGCTVTFQVNGDDAMVEELPERVVPQAFRDWGMTLFDWQTAASTRVTKGSVATRLKRLFPIVGCEADAVAFQEESVSTPVSLAWLPGGTFGAATADRLESCFTLPDGVEPLGLAPLGCLSPGRCRIRLIHRLQRSKYEPTGCWTVASLELHMERYEGPYDGGANLRSCGASVPGFAEKPRLAAELLEGNWRSMVGAASVDDAQMARRWLLPLGAWAGARDGEGGSQVFEAGVMLGADVRLRSRFDFDRGGALRGSLVWREERMV